MTIKSKNTTGPADGVAVGVASKTKVNPPKIVTQDEWLAARKEFLAREKEFDHERDRLTEARRKLPMVKIEKEYVFDGPEGAVTLNDLFAGRTQLIVYHFMFVPDDKTGCKHCSCVMDNIAGSLVHLTARDTSFVAVSRAPIARIEAFKSRMQWTFPWVSSFNNDFNYDYHVTLDPARGSTVYNYEKVDFRGEMPGLSVFFLDNDLILHSYSTYFRGIDILLPMYHLLDRTPLGRQEDKGNSMAAGEASWIRYHDEYPTITLDGGKMTTESKTPSDFREATESKKVPKIAVDGTAGMILGFAEMSGTPDQVFRALMTNEVEKWRTIPGIYYLKDWQADLHAQGRWSVTVELHDGRQFNEWGEFCEVDAPNKIVMTRRFGANPLLGERETTLTYRLTPSPQGTLLTLREEGFIGRPEAAYGNAENWQKVLGWLNSYLLTQKEK